VRCEEARDLILEQTLEGDSLPAGGALAQHLQACPSCRLFWARVAMVDAALRDLPLMAAPAGLRARILERIPTTPTGEFLPWTLWMPVLSLVSGVAVACVVLLFHQGSVLSDTFSPALAEWIVRAQQWLLSNGSVLSTVALSVTVGLLFTAVAIGLGLYMGRTRPAYR